MSDILDGHSSRVVYDANTDQLVYENVTPVAFRETANLSRSYYFTHFFALTGKIREYALEPIGRQLADQLAGGEWGLVTNWADLKVFSECFSYDRIYTRFRIGFVSGSVIPLVCEFYSLGPNGEKTPLARVSQETTWVKIVGHGLVQPEPFPKYLGDYLDKYGQKAVVPEMNSTPDCRFHHVPSGEKVAENKLTVKGLPVLAQKTFETSLEEANLVGNVYYGNYFVWQGRLRDHFIHKLMPELFKDAPCRQEMKTISSRMDYLRDAMPFDNVTVKMGMQRLYERKVLLRFEYFRELPNGRSEKLAVGSQELIWVVRDENNHAVQTSFPRAIVEGLTQKVPELA